MLFLIAVVWVGIAVAPLPVLNDAGMELLMNEDFSADESTVFQESARFVGTNWSHAFAESYLNRAQTVIDLFNRHCHQVVGLVGEDLELSARKAEFWNTLRNRPERLPEEAIVWVRSWGGLNFCKVCTQVARECIDESIGHLSGIQEEVYVWRDFASIERRKQIVDRVEALQRFEAAVSLRISQYERVKSRLQFLENFVNEKNQLRVVRDDKIDESMKFAVFGARTNDEAIRHIMHIDRKVWNKFSLTFQTEHDQLYTYRDRISGEITYFRAILARL